MNISPQQFIIQYRLSEACELLKTLLRHYRKLLKKSATPTNSIFQLLLKDITKFLQIAGENPQINLLRILDVRGFYSINSQKPD